MSWLAIRSIARAEAAAIYRSWLVRIWVGFALLTLLFPVLIASGQEEAVSDVVGGWLAVYFVPSAVVAAVFGAGAISQDTDIAADSILTRAVTRYDYVAAKLLSRVFVVATVHVTATLPMVFLARRAGSDDATTDGLIMSSLLTGVLLVFLTVLGVAAGTVLRNLAIAAVAIMVAFLSEGLIFDFLDIAFLSPTQVIRELPETIRGEIGAWEQARVLLAFTAGAIISALAALQVFERREL